MDEACVEAVEEDLATSTRIRKQVEWYLSDENLSRPDQFLLDIMNASEDGAIPLETICSFKKMRRFRRLSVVLTALKDSERLSLIELADSTWVVQRKSPFDMKSVKAKTSKSIEEASVKAKKVKPTGFEEHWTDPPIDAETHHEERNLYDPSRPLVERIQTAIQRYEARRRFSSLRRNIFLKFLRYGGIDTSPRQFTGGMAIEDFEDHTADEIRAMTSTLVVGDDVNTGLDTDNARWVVDFESIAKGFLSSKVPECFPVMDHELIEQVTSTLSNFYNYLLMHDVCPEYSASIFAARGIAIRATKELGCVSDVMFPGDFNKACSIVFGGYFATYVASDEDCADTGQSSTSITAEQAQMIYEHGISTIKANEPPHTDIGSPNEQVTVIKTERVGLEVLEIGTTDDKTRNALSKRGSFPIEPLGRLRTRYWLPPSFAQKDHPRRSRDEAADHLTLWVENKVLSHCFVGMKIETTVTSLSNGIHFFENVTAAHCSFYTILENELITQWKPPRWYTREEIGERLQSRHYDDTGGLMEKEEEE